MTDQPFLSYDALLATTENAVLELLDGKEDQTVRRHLALGVVTLFRQVGILNTDGLALRQRFTDDAERLDGLISAARGGFK
ncbi:hypothetical protein [Burkholderia gladioli]|uniref:hypothetical protein n=1 Tax=Burkholderia gladioli TaxID=28095 RepID=UPI002FE402BE